MLYGTNGWTNYSGNQPLDPIGPEATARANYSSGTILPQPVPGPDYPYSGAYRTGYGSYNSPAVDGYNPYAPPIATPAYAPSFYGCEPANGYYSRGWGVGVGGDGIGPGVRTGPRAGYGVGF